MEHFSYHLESFDGPLDLLLQLLAKNKLSICDISILSIVDQFVEQVDAMCESDMDVSSEFLEMAAKLIEMKSASLLPRHEEEPDEKQELVGRLLEYQECKRMAAILGASLSFDSFVRDAQELEPDRIYRRSHDPGEIHAAYLSAAGRGKRRAIPTPGAFAGIVAHRIVSVSAQIVSVLRKLWKGDRLSYYSLFEGKTERSEQVATFLAVLELVKARRVIVDGLPGHETVQMRGTREAWRSERSREP